MACAAPPEPSNRTTRSADHDRGPPACFPGSPGRATRPTEAERRAQEAEVRAAHAEQELQLTKEQLSELLEEEWEVKRELQQELRGLSGLLPDSS